MKSPTLAFQIAVDSVMPDVDLMLENLPDQSTKEGAFTSQLAGQPGSSQPASNHSAASQPDSQQPAATSQFIPFFENQAKRAAPLSSAVSRRTVPPSLRIEILEPKFPGESLQTFSSERTFPNESSQKHKFPC